MPVIQIYQLYFKKEQTTCLNRYFIPFDNTVNLRPNDREYPLLLKCYQQAYNSCDYWGAFPWNFQFKFSLEEQHTSLFHNIVENNAGYDIYTFNPFTNTVPVIWNVWEQGQWCHPHMIEIMNEIFYLMNDNSLTAKQDRNSIFFGSMAVANNKFWKGYFDYVRSFISALNKLSTKTQKLYMGSANYFDNINYFSFIQERLMSSYVAACNLKTHAWHRNEDCAEPHVYYLEQLKQKNTIQWLQERKPYAKMLYNDFHDYAENWIK